VLYKAAGQLASSFSLSYPGCKGTIRVVHAYFIHAVVFVIQHVLCPVTHPMDFLARLASAWPPADWSDVTVVVAVSGGADSASLLCALAELRPKDAAGRLVAAHFNHRLRATADDDERFVRELSKKLRLDFEVGYASPPEGGTSTASGLAGGDGVEAAAREARYAFLLATAEKLGARYVATAHTADDQAETILHRVIRGTGLAGLAGIPRVRPLSPAATLIRPLLDCCRSDVVHYLSERHQTYCIDESNADPTFTRNRIRHALLPQLAAQYNPNVREALLRLGQLAGDAQQVIEERAQALAERALRITSPDRLAINCQSLANEPRHLIRELLVQIWKQQQWPLQQMGLDEWQSIAELIASARSDKQQRTLNLPGNIRAEVMSGQLIFTRSTST
jgi:tRNA(Ile)-lysidine synthase